MARRAIPAADSEGSTLIDWSEPSRNAHVLDWRERAHEFGLVPVDPAETVDGDVVEPPDRLLMEEEPEAADPQLIDELDESGAPPDAGRMPAEDVDLVRVYLKQIGRRKLLKARDERELGARIEGARGDVLAALGAIPAARNTLLALADCV